MDSNVNDEQLIFEGLNFKDTLLSCIRNAQKEILITCYIVEDDDYGRQILGALLKRAQEGVKIRMLVDGFGSFVWVNEKMDDYKHPNFQIRVYHSLIASFLKLKFSRLNRRNHQKVFIFDQDVAMLGSRNINDDAMNWRETNIMIKGPSSVTLCSLFTMIWQRTNPLVIDENMIRIKGSEHVFSNYRFSLRDKLQKVTLDHILSAKSEIKITTPYFFPTGKIMRAILKKAQEGVDVSVLLPRISDVVISKWITERHYQRLLAVGVKIFEYKPKILHAKSMVIDDWAVIGSSNFNRRSVFRDLELDYGVSQIDTVKKLREQFIQDTKESAQITSLPPMSIFKRVFVSIATRISPSSF